MWHLLDTYLRAQEWKFSFPYSCCFPGGDKFVRRPGKEPMVEEATKYPLSAPYPQRLKKDKQEMQSQQFLKLFK